MAFHPDQFLPTSEPAQSITRRLYASVKGLPLICPHGHTEPEWFARNPTFADPVELLVLPDHYVVRMLISQGISFAEIGIGKGAETDRRKIWHLFAAIFLRWAIAPW